MKPIVVSTSVTRPREQVFDYLDLLANHTGFNDHMFTEWSFSGPERGVGAKGRAKVNAPGSREWAEFEVIESVRPERTVERGISANGRRRTLGTYRLAEREGGGTEIEFELAWEEVPRSERLLPPLSRAFLRRALGKAMRRLAAELEAE